MCHMTPQSHCNPHSQKGHASSVSVTQGRTHTSLSLTIALTLRDKITLPAAQAPTAPRGRADSRGCAPTVHALSASRNPSLTATGCPSWAPATSAQSSSRRPKPDSSSDGCHSRAVRNTGHGKRTGVQSHLAVCGT